MIQPRPVFFLTSESAIVRYELDVEYESNYLNCNDEQR